MKSICVLLVKILLASGNAGSLFVAREKNSIPNVVNGQSNPIDIANAFRTHFSSIFTDSSKNIEAVDEFKKLRANLSQNSELFETLTTESVEKAIHQLHCNKAPDSDGITSEHILHSHLRIVIHIKFLFTMMLTHCFVPDSFTVGIITP